MRKPAKLLTLMAIFLAALLVSYFVFRAKPVDLIVEMNLLDTKNAQRGELFVAGSFSQTVEICGAGPYEDGLREHETALWAKDKFGLKIWQLKIDRFQYENPFFLPEIAWNYPKERYSKYACGRFLTARSTLRFQLLSTLLQTGITGFLLQGSLFFEAQLGGQQA